MVDPCHLEYTGRGDAAIWLDGSCVLIGVEKLVQSGISGDADVT